MVNNLFESQDDYQSPEAVEFDRAQLLLLNTIGHLRSSGYPRREVEEAVIRAAPDVTTVQKAVKALKSRLPYKYNYSPRT